MNAPLGIVGSGAWGTALAYALSKRIPVKLYANDPEEATKVKRVLKRKKAAVEVICQIDQLFKQCEHLIIAIPFQVIPSWFSIHGQVYDMDKHVFINASKGLSADTLQFFPQLVPPNIKIGVLSGPSFADEVLAGEPTTVVFASEDKSLCHDFQRTFSQENLRIYIQNDILGVSMGGALKNVLAIASGLSHGLGLKKNAIGALVTRGVWEIASIAKRFGANPQTIFGLSGLGDILLSCYSPKSRNMHFGQLIGKGLSIPEALEKIGSTVEGYPTTRAVYQLAKKHHIESPIFEEIFYILYKGKSSKESLTELMTRPLKHEIFP